MNRGWRKTSPRSIRESAEYAVDMAHDGQEWLFLAESSEYAGMNSRKVQYLAHRLLPCRVQRSVAISFTCTPPSASNDVVCFELIIPRRAST
jgi:hypothetical protein